MVKTNENLSKASPAVYSIVPVVTVLGHVDHGKTSLLDAIRKTNIALREHGGITQKIGASQVQVTHEGKARKITFIDTPGHEAFMEMRGRGAKVADIGLLVVSSVDGVMPQTQESIKILKSAKIPYITVITKSDVPEKNIEKVKGQLLKEEVLLEGQGGDVPVIEVSAKTGQNIKELLDLILLVSDLHPSQVSDSFKGVVIESRLDTKAGPKATVVIRGGKLSVRDEIQAQEAVARVKSLLNDKGDLVKDAQVGDAVEVLGFEKVPVVGSIVHRVGEKVEEEKQEERKFEAGEDMLKVIIVADTLGSLEAIINKIWDKLNIVLQKTGEVSPADIDLAKSVGAVILGFNAKISIQTKKLAEDEKVIMRNYNLIYEMLDEIEDFLEGKRLSLEPKILGKAKVLALFPFDKKQVLGVQVMEGRVAKGDKVEIVRNEEAIGAGTVISLRQGKEQISKVEKGGECGILLSNEFDFRVGDMVVSQG